MTLSLASKSGRHRSVAMTEILSRCLTNWGMWVDVIHQTQLHPEGGWERLCNGYLEGSQCAERKWGPLHYALHNFASELFRACVQY